jgi:predicted unusual protein kinase regulating ubiquinone biosynthesis (AarF/ABC1/UbiB family)
MIKPRLLRLAIAGVAVAGIYLSYKVPQVAGRLGLRRDTRADVSRRHRRNAERLYRLAARLQGLMIKPCQFLSSRADLVPDEYIEVLSRLQDQVPARPYRQMRRVIVDELGAPPEKLYARFDKRPIASASLAQVHRARLHDGREVAVKIQYPGIQAIAEADLKNMALLARVLKLLEPVFDFTPIVRELENLCPLELDFENEGRNAETVAHNLRHRPEFIVPGIVWERTSRRVLTMDYIPGVKISEVAAMRARGIDTAAVAQLLTEAYCEQMLINGFFHADPHPGNLIVQPGPRIALIDFGLSKRFPAAFRRAFVELTRAIITKDDLATANAFKALGFRARSDDPKTFLALGDAFLGRAVRENRVYADHDMVAEINAMLTRTLKENPVVEVPTDIVLVGRVTGLLAGLAKMLDSKVDLLETMMPYVAQRAMTEDGRAAMLELLTPEERAALGAAG